jgi:CMP-N,N'-diacetyllegionaminic acid synthase
MRVLGIIPARGGSKAIPRKNLLPLLGKSLIERTFETARASGALDRIILSTDEREIVELGRRIGLEVPFERPAEFAGDTSPMIDVVVHSITTLGQTGYAPDAVMVLQPTSPLRQPRHIRDSVALLQAHPEADGVCTVSPLPKELCPHYLVKIGPTGYLEFFMPDGARYRRRQDVPQAWRRDGTIFLTRTDVLLNQRSFYGERCLTLELEPTEILNIDEPADWEEAERRLRLEEGRASR